MFSESYATFDVIGLILQAAREGDVAIIERLMEKYQTNQAKKKRLNSRDDSKLTPLHYAARYCHYHMLQYLLKNGASK